MARLSKQDLPRNVWAVSLTSFFMDISSEMVLNILPLYLTTVLNTPKSIVGLIEGVAEATASILKVFSGWLSDRLGSRKWLAVVGYGISALSKPFFYFAGSWGTIFAARWSDRVGKGVRTAPRDALVADSVPPEKRGLAFGLHRASDTAGAMLGLIIALIVVLVARNPDGAITRPTFQTLVLISIAPALLAVLSLAIGAREVQPAGPAAKAQVSFRGLGKPFLVFMVIAGIFDIGNSSDAFLVLRAQERGLDTAGILGMLITFNLIYTLISTPAGSLSDRVGRRKMIIGGWLAYAVIYFGFASATHGWHVWALYALYGVYYGLSYGTAKALVADLVPPTLRGTAFGTYNFVLGLLDFPASLIAGVLWQGVGGWPGFGAAAPFYFGAGAALLASLLLIVWRPPQVVATQY
ncbi:MAG: MFS transporter [Anaerolineales bacterium]